MASRTKATRAPASKPAPKADEPERKVLVVAEEGKTQHRQFAELSFAPTTLSAVTARSWSEKVMGDIGINEALAIAKERGELASAGDLDAAKGMLSAQAMALDAIFNEMARKAATLMQHKSDGTWSFNGQSMEALMRIAFKAQGQCRATLQTLGELVNPRSVAFIKQANMANGPQQVNNGQEPARTETASVGSNKLLEATPSERLDFGAQAAAGGANQDLETVGAVNRTENRAGKVRRFPQRDQARGA